MSTKLTHKKAKKFPSLLAILALVVSCNDATECKQDGSLQTAFNKLVCQNSPQTLGTDGTATLTFYCYWDWESSTQGVRPNGPVREIEVTFTSVGGSCTASGKTETYESAAELYLNPAFEKLRKKQLAECIKTGCTWKHYIFDLLEVNE